MFISQNPYYFATVRKLSVAFGTLFNNISIQRYTSTGNGGSIIRTVDVPLVYSQGQKWYVRRTQKVDAQSETRYRTVVPIIGYELVGMQYDSQRKLQTLQSNVATNAASVSNFLKQLTPLPYDFQFEVRIATKNMNDMLQIVEQIIPYFQPSFNLVINDIPELNIQRDVKCVFGGIQMQDNYEGNFDENRILEWSLSFVVKGYLYPPVENGDIIRKVLASVYNDVELTNKDVLITTEVNPSTAGFNDDWSDKTIIYEEDELDSNGDPI